MITVKVMFMALVRKEGALGSVYEHIFTADIPLDREENFIALALPTIYEAGYEFHGGRVIRFIPENVQ